jgi:uncharacterized membrane protein
MKYKNRKELLGLLAQHRVKEENIAEAVHVSGIAPTKYDFLVFTRMVLLWVGAIALVMALLMFMAYNWDDLGRFAKFIIVEVSLVATAVIYFFTGKYKLLQQISLMLASITLGILLALIGQTYQTGADPWQLFAAWALLMTPWAVVAGYAGLWILWILLLNLAMILYHQKFDLSLFLFLEMSDKLLELMFALNTMLWLAWAYLSTKYETFQDTLSMRFLAFISMASITSLSIFSFYAIFTVSLWHFALYALTLGFVYIMYRVRSIDMYMMSLFTLSLFFFALGIVFRFVSFDIFNDITSFVLVMLVVIGGLTSLIVSWMKRLKKEQHAND